MITNPRYQSNTINGALDMTENLAMDSFPGVRTSQTSTGLKGPHVCPFLPNESYGNVEGHEFIKYPEIPLMIKVGVNPMGDGTYRSVVFVPAICRGQDRYPFYSFIFLYMSQKHWLENAARPGEPIANYGFTCSSREFNDYLVLLGWDYMPNDPRRDENTGYKLGLGS